MNTRNVIELAEKHVGNDAAMQSSAQVCLDDAKALYDKGAMSEARFRALKSLKYSVGIMHADYQRAAQPEYRR